MPQDYYESYNLDHVKIDPVKSEVKPEFVKTEENVKNKQDYMGGEDVQKTIKSVSFAKY